MNRLSKIDSTIIIAILTVLLYGIACAYQVSYKGYYKLPAMFIELNINTITPTLMTVFIYFASICALGYAMKFFFLAFLTTFIPSRFIDKFTQSEFIKFMRPTINEMLPFLLSLLLVFMFLGAIYKGDEEASGKKEYMVIKQTDGLYVEVSSYKDLIVIAPLDLKKESMVPKFKTIEMKELKDGEMVYFENGLKVEEMRNSKDLNGQIILRMPLIPS
jgi:hypothetical protein